ncbi:MAG TPA: ribosomal protein S18-alanine N-acetyltransferase [Desulfuromonadaceae bacterium]
MPAPGIIFIRSMRESDLDAVLAIEEASFPLPWRRDHFLHELGAPHAFPLVAEADGALVGYLCLMSLFEEAQILDVAVDPQQRGKGVARMLMEHAFAVAREQGAEFMALEVRASNVPAIALYERLGFARTGTRRGYYEGKEDAVLMEKTLLGDS